MPRSILPQRVLQMSDGPFDEFLHIILKKHIEIKNIEVKHAFRFSKRKELELRRAINHRWHTRLLDYCYDKLRSARRVLQANLDNKLTRLIENSRWTKDANPSFIVNLSDKQLDKTTSCALGYGMSFACNKDIDYVDVARGFCNLEKFGDLSMMKLGCVKVLYILHYQGLWYQIVLIDSILHIKL